MPAPRLRTLVAPCQVGYLGPVEGHVGVVLVLWRHAERARHRVVREHQEREQNHTLVTYDTKNLQQSTYVLFPGDARGA